NRIEHGDNPTLHVARASAKHEMLLAERPELFGGWCGNDVILSVEIKSPFSAPIPRKQANARFACILFRVGGINACAFDAAFSQPPLENIRACEIISPRGIFRGNGNELGQECGHLVLALAQPVKNLAGSCSTLARSSAHLATC